MNCGLSFLHNILAIAFVRVHDVYMTSQLFPATLFPMEEVSKLLHISISSLRHYENIRLLTPAYISPDSGYRYAGHGAAGHALRCSSN